MGFVYDRNAVPLAWFVDDVVYARNGDIQAWVQDGAVFSVESRYTGQLDSGIFLDRQGNAVGFLRGASSPLFEGITTLTEPAQPAVPLERPAPPSLPNPPAPPQPTGQWSDLTWGHHLHPDGA